MPPNAMISIAIIMEPIETVLYEYTLLLLLLFLLLLLLLYSILKEEVYQKQH